ncbi:MAG: DapH/DapD/GlmU-related protein [Candidatus Delongbacteria bacterium]|jgi:acetyltransferase-like isoleucine patch superfamily enzyme|nr:DapH/DapD/GlmU-related protein [Candidatus Delongbacteria bacterium]
MLINLLKFLKKILSIEKTRILFFLKHIKNNVNISYKLNLKNFKNITLGKENRIGEFVTLFCWNKNSSINIGNNCVIENYGILEALKGSIEIGNNSTVNQFSIFRAYGNIKIGNGVRIGPNVQIMAMNHKFDDQNKYIYEQGLEGKGISIGNNVWIGGGVIILDGINIGNNCVVGAGTVVTKNIPDNSLVVGNPGKVIKKLNFNI